MPAIHGIHRISKNTRDYLTQKSDRMWSRPLAAVPAPLQKIVEEVVINTLLLVVSIISFKLLVELLRFDAVRFLVFYGMMFASIVLIDEMFPLEDGGIYVWLNYTCVSFLVFYGLGHLLSSRLFGLLMVSVIPIAIVFDLICISWRMGPYEAAKAMLGFLTGFCLFTEYVQRAGIRGHYVIVY